ncbi:hypothetical protein P171DRAFT_113056 [Karstenula rhodostoma CBS 690.94]|uniref:Uncharacterized protein n=1 Tax=Karstenula rhodostoma CBS 690.94 TaxID=1392251 RepID=A0A9P4U7H0_9PLEO|nr:hypothetical protein P171DRAFT_113056 [Karstenula rhodostoma CBS 690.94]
MSTRYLQLCKAVLSACRDICKLTPLLITAKRRRVSLAGHVLREGCLGQTLEMDAGSYPLCHPWDPSRAVLELIDFRILCAPRWSFGPAFLTRPTPAHDWLRFLKPTTIAWLLECHGTSSFPARWSVAHCHSSSTHVRTCQSRCFGLRGMPLPNRP